jgi:hypothetical protein
MLDLRSCNLENAKLTRCSKISVLRAAERVSMRNSDQIVDELMRVLDEYASTLLRFRPYFTAFKGLAGSKDFLFFYLTNDSECAFLLIL